MSKDRGRHRFGRLIRPESLLFHLLLSPVILQFGGHIGDGSLCVKISLIGGGSRRFLYFAFDKRPKLHSLQGLIIVDLLDNFLNPLKLFMGLASDFTKSL